MSIVQLHVQCTYSTLRGIFVFKVQKTEKKTCPLLSMWPSAPRLKPSSTPPRQIICPDTDFPAQK